MYEILLVIQTLAQVWIALLFCNTCVFSLGISLALCAQFDILFCNIKNLEYTVALQHGRNMNEYDAQRLLALQAKINLEDLHHNVHTFPFCVEKLEDLNDLQEVARSAGENGPNNAFKKAPATNYSWQNSNSISALLHKCVEHHQHLIYCAEQLEDIHNPVCLGKFLVLTMQLCILALNVLRVRFFSLFWIKSGLNSIFQHVFGNSSCR